MISRLSIVLALIASHSVVSNGAAQAQGQAQTQAGGAQPVRMVWPDESGPLKWAPRPTATPITANDLRTRLYQIADDSMRGRRVGEPGNFKTTAYIEREFRRLGLKPAGDNGTFFQDLPWGGSGIDTANARFTVAGAALAPRTEWYPTLPTTAGAAERVDLSNIETVFAGRLGDSTVSLDMAMFRGKVAVFLAPAAAPGGGGGGGGGGGARGGGAANVCPAELGWPNQRGASDALANARGGGAGGRAAAPAAAAPPAAAAAGAPPAGRAGGGGGGRGGRGGGAAGGDPRISAIGAVAVLVVQPELAANTANTAFAQRTGMRANIAGGGIGMATISAGAAAKIFGRSLDQAPVGASGQRITASWRYEFRISPTPGRNVIAVLPGSDPARAGQYVLVGAHNDHVGTNNAAVDHDSLRAFNTIMRPQGANDQVNCRPNATQQRLIDSLIARARTMRPPRRDSIMNGADDDGSGTVILMELAEAFAATKPARSIIFISHQAEENGLLGSAWFVDHATLPLDSIVAAHNMDMVGKGRATDVRLGGPAQVQTLGSRRLSRAFGDIIDSVNALSRAPMTIDRSWDVPLNPLNRFCRSDQVNYVRSNIPVTYFSTGYSRDYHQATDEPQYIDYDKSARLGNFLLEVMSAIANRKDKPSIDGPDPNYPSCGR